MVERQRKETALAKSPRLLVFSAGIPIGKHYTPKDLRIEFEVLYLLAEWTNTFQDEIVRTPPKELPVQNILASSHQRTMSLPTTATEKILIFKKTSPTIELMKKNLEEFTASAREKEKEEPKTDL